MLSDPPMCLPFTTTANAHCFMKGLAGTLNEVRFEWPKKSAKSMSKEWSKQRNVSRQTVCYINDSLGLHRVENPSHSDGAVSLHLYCPPYSSCSMFDERTGKRTKCPVTFWSKFGKKCETRKS
ncbi:cysteine dioxygenase-like [Macrobrachium rosenbergii]|uniref:cysteine dioxygenase-like n=1 Tax=Macrobrachium rosenbergii TaxID=79674 RepID=UPI0034D68C33